jgi:hypothetical protein
MRTTPSAVRAGIALVGAIGQFGAPDPLQARIGVSTGVVVVGDLIGQGEAQDRGFVGEAPNLAAALQTLAEPNAIVIADSTRDQVGALFEVADLGPQQLRGLGAPQHAWRILGEREGLSRFEALRSRDTPLIGREEEIELLSRRWSQAKAGAGRVVLISGEPGIGKSRLAEAFRECVMGEPHARLRYFCSPHHQDSALFPIIGQLERAAGFAGGDTPEAKLGKLEALIAANAPAEGDVALLAELLSLSFEGRYAALELTPQRKKEKTFEALLRQFAGLARRQPVLVIFEDLHWADPTSRELLDLIVEQVERLPGLLIATFRPEFHPSWTGQSHLTTCSLRRLGPKESDELVRGMVGNIAALSSEVVDEIVERSDGVPLFLEELTKAVIEIATAGRGSVSAVPATSLAVPATLHASLIARLDHLGPTAREIAQVGAAIGRDFSYELLAITAERTEAELRDALGRLVDAGLVFQRGVVPQATFLFKHALVQDTAYGMLLRGPRQPAIARADRQSARSPFPRDDREPARAPRAALRRGRAGRKICHLLGQGRSQLRHPLGDGGGGRAIAQGAGPASSAARRPRTTATGTRILDRLGRSLAGRKRPRRARNGPCLCPRTRTLGAAGFSLGVPSDPLWAVCPSRVPRRTRFGAALGRGFAASEPSAQRFRRARSGSHLLRSKPYVCRQACFVPVASGRGACAL